MRVSLVCAAFVASGLFLLPTVALADLPPIYHVGDVTLSESSSYFTTTSNFDRYGNKVNDSQLCGFSDCYFHTLTNSVDGVYDLDSGLGVWRFGAGVNINYSASRGPDFPSGEKDRTNSQFNNIHFVIQKPIPLQMFRLIPEIKGSVALNPINLNQIPYSVGTNYYDDALTSDDADTAQIGTWAVGNFPLGSLYAYVGYEYRDAEFASLIPWSVGGLAHFHQFFGGIEMDGYDNATNDQYGYGREMLTNRVDGGSFRYFAANPIESEFRLNAGYKFTPDFSVSAGFSNTISGQEVAIGQTLFASLSYSFSTSGGTGAYNGDLLPHNSKGISTGHQGRFQPKSEKYDKSLFESD